MLCCIVCVYIITNIYGRFEVVNAKVFTVVDSSPKYMDYILLLTLTPLHRRRKGQSKKVQAHLRKPTFLFHKRVVPNM